MHASTLEPMSAQAWSRRASVLLTLAFGGAVAIVLASAWRSPTALWFFPAAIPGFAALFWLGRDEVRTLVAITIGFVLVVDYEKGIAPPEVLYGLVLYGYLGWWFVTRLFVYRDDFLSTTIDRALFAFLVWVTGSLGLTYLFRGSFPVAINEWLSIVAIAYYFPVREIVRRRNANWQILAAAGFVTLFITVRNLLEYRAEITSAESLWQIAAGRVVQNEHLLMFAGLFCLVFLLNARSNWAKVAFGTLVLLFSAGVIVGLSRSLWVSYGLGSLVILALSERRQRILLLTVGTAGTAILLLVAALAFPGFFELIFAGLIDRLFSLSTATSVDISLVNRFIEAGAAWDLIQANPVVGYGLGVPYRYYSLVYELDHQTTFVHNGYVGAWYRHGLIGFGLLMTFYFGTLLRGVRLSRSPVALHRQIGVSVAACLTATTLHTLVANPFATSEKMFFFGLMAGLLAGCATVTQGEGASKAR